MLKNKKHCPAIVGIYYFVDGITSPTEIGKILGVPTPSVCQILNRKFNVVGKRRTASDEMLDEIEREYLEGATTYALGEKYGFDHTVIGKWMRKRGHVRGKGFKLLRQKNLGAIKSAEISRKRAEDKLRERCSDSFDLVTYGGDKNTFRCKQCGCVFTRTRLAQDETLRCPECTRVNTEQRKAKRDLDKKQREDKRSAEYEKEKTCLICGRVFHSAYPSKKFCSDECSKRNKINKKNERDRKKTAARQDKELQKTKVCACCGDVFHSVYKNKKYCEKCSAKQRHCDHRFRANRYGVEYDPTVTIDALIERDGNICQICGQPCDKNDKSWNNGIGPLYPTIDHIIAMSKGGPHTWDNVQLAHAYCNCAIKRDLDMSEVVL